jgi:membrane fusion protein (multidrug efflux system)
MINAGTRMMTVRASLKNDGNLIPGAFVSIQYNLGMEKQAFMVPTESIVPVLKGQNIFVVREGKALEIPVEMGIRTEDKVQVIGDLKSGDKVLISGILSVKNGMPITTKLVKK